MPRNPDFSTERQPLSSSLGLQGLVILCAVVLNWKVPAEIDDLAATCVDKGTHVDDLDVMGYLGLIMYYGLIEYMLQSNTYCMAQEVSAHQQLVSYDDERVKKNKNAWVGRATHTSGVLANTLGLCLTFCVAEADIQSKQAIMLYTFARLLMVALSNCNRIDSSLSLSSAHSFFSAYREGTSWLNKANSWFMRTAVLMALGAFAAELQEDKPTGLYVYSVMLIERLCTHLLELKTCSEQICANQRSETSESTESSRIVWEV